MKHLFLYWDRLKDELRNKSLSLFLDYDGTLTPIVKIPVKAVIPKETKEIVRRLSKDYNCKLAIISGRSLKDIKNIVGIKDIVYAGNHGLEMEGPKIKFECHVPPRLKSIIRRIKDELTRNLLRINGVLIEDKGLTISVHYRLVNKKEIPWVKNKFSEVIQPYIKQDRIKINRGKKVYEIKPPVMWNKGKVVLRILKRQGFIKGMNKVFPIYIGDDITDEDAFKVIKNKGLTIRVGRSKKSNAQYYLRNTREVIKFLKAILAVKERT